MDTIHFPTATGLPLEAAKQAILQKHPYLKFAVQRTGEVYDLGLSKNTVYISVNNNNIVIGIPYCGWNEPVSSKA
jgi:hypothetical protein